MFWNDSTKIGNSPIKSLFIELAKLDVDLSTAETAIEQARVAERHWAIREKIVATPASNLHDAIWMARAAQLEIERDPDFTNDAAWSAAHLASLVVADMIRFAGSAE